MRQPLDGTLAVTRGKFDHARRGEWQDGLVAQRFRILCGRRDAHVPSETDDDDPLRAVGLEEAAELGAGHVAADRVAHTEARVAVAAVDALADDRAVDGELRMQLSSPGPGHAVDRPRTSVGGEVRCALRVPVLGVDDQAAGVAAGADARVDLRQDRLRVGDGQAA